jgi:histidinol dehydrogenase
LEAANAIAPEHLELMCAGAEDLVHLVRNAGAVFVGADASAVIGDYVAGVNHVLPTGGTARYTDALRVDDFRKHVHVVSLEPGALAGLAPFVTTLADAEGLTAHADAIRLRAQS